MHCLPFPVQLSAQLQKLTASKMQTPDIHNTLVSEGNDKLGYSWLIGICGSGGERKAEGLGWSFPRTEEC